MHVVFEKALCNGIVSMHFDESWDLLKYNLTRVETFDTEMWESKNYAIESLHNGNIISDGSALWQYVDMNDRPTEFELFSGRIVLLDEIDPIS